MTHDDPPDLSGDQTLVDIVALAAALCRAPCARLAQTAAEGPRVLVTLGRVPDVDGPDDDVRDTSATGTGFRAAAPVMDEGRVWGWLSVSDDTSRPDDPATLDHLARLARLAEMRVALSRERRHLRHALDTSASSDGRLRALASHLEVAQRIAAIGSWENRIGANRLSWSDEIYRIFGLARTDFDATFDAFFAKVHPDDRAAMLEAHEATLAGRGPMDIVHRIIRPDGTIRVVRERGELLREGDETVLAGTVQDITEQARAEHALRESEERFREMAETIEDVFWTWDAREDRILYASPSYESVFGQPRDELYRDSRSFHRRVDPEDLPGLLEAVAADPFAIHIEYRIVGRDGERRWIDVRTFPVRDGSGAVVRTVGIGRDITRLKTAEQALLRTQRMESIGTLAGGIAHDLNNVLTPIVIAAGALASTSRSTTENELLETITESAARGSAMVRQVLSFARGVEGRRTPLRLDYLVNDIGRVLRDTFDRRIQIEQKCDAGLWHVAGDATQLHQVLLNLAVNARDAMPEGGRLRMHVRNVVIDEETAALTPDARSGRYVLLTVSDTGTGIPANLRVRVFDPFFTTKPQGQGTGLGLSTVQTLVRSHGGFLTLVSMERVGTSVKVYVPALQDPAAGPDA